jgi:excisionase family DNA binding protein
VKEVQWLTVAQVADRLAVHPKTVYEWIRAGELAATKFGPQTIRVRVSEVERFEEEGIEG